MNAVCSCCESPLAHKCPCNMEDRPRCPCCGKCWVHRRHRGTPTTALTKTWVGRNVPARLPKVRSLPTKPYCVRCRHITSNRAGIWGQWYPLCGKCWLALEQAKKQAGESSERLREELQIAAFPRKVWGPIKETA
jgi:hypothetical protein